MCTSSVHAARDCTHRRDDSSTSTCMYSWCTSVNWLLHLFFFLSLCLPTEDEDEEVVAQPDKNELQNLVHTLCAKLEDLNTCHDLISKHGIGLQKALTELEQINFAGNETATVKVKAVNERATLFRITSNAMINVSCDLGQVVIMWFCTVFFGGDQFVLADFFIVSCS